MGQFPFSLMACFCPRQLKANLIAPPGATRSAIPFTLLSGNHPVVQTQDSLPTNRIKNQQ